MTEGYTSAVDQYRLQGRSPLSVWCYAGIHSTAVFRICISVDRWNEEVLSDTRKNYNEVERGNP